ncbi:MAG: hypothetical protein E7062_01725 [Spirochaetaceae bacterium]|nr:hypothetical protein [Spirochaetaceae bacterium]
MKIAKKVITSILVIFLSVCSLFAFGKKDTDAKSVSQLNSWQETFDISEKKTGKYNIVISAQDVGGNTSLVGPFNIAIDPKSDLPIVGITNPLNGMRVPGNLNIVGTCIDDDAVERVEIILDNDTENVIVAEGKDFWSCYLDTTTLMEGLHTITVYGIDINGLRGNAVSSTWHLDRRLPETEIKNHGMGDLVSGRIDFEGIIEDGNGIAELFYSVDNGENFSKIGIKSEKDNATFNFGFDTKKLKDGPAVFWFKAIDGQGSVGYYSFLVFIDNTPPDVTVVSPKIGESVNGKFSVTGYAKDVIGVKSMTWSLDGATGSIPVIPGNPFWQVDFDIRGKNISATEFAINVEDIAGNIIQVTKKIPVDVESDKPVVTLNNPRPNEVMFEYFFVQGFITDDDGVAEVYYSLDNKETITLSTEKSFIDDVYKRYGKENLKEGLHTVKVWAKDCDGIVGNPVEVQFFIGGEKPLISPFKVKNAQKADNSLVDYQFALPIHPERNGSFLVTIESACGLKEVTYEVLGKEKQKIAFENAAKGKTSIEIALSGSHWGYIPVTVTALDIYDRKTTEEYTFYVENLTKTRGDLGLVFADSTISEKGEIFLQDKNFVSGYFVGDAIASCKLVPETKFATLKVIDNGIQFVPGSEMGTSKPVQVEIVTAKGITYRSQSFVLRTKVPAPEIILTDTALRNGDEMVKIQGNIRGFKPITSLQSRILRVGITEPWQDVAFSGDSFDFNYPAEAFKNGVFVVELKAVDSEGGIALNHVFVRSLDPIPVPEGKKAAPIPKPVISWFAGEQYYYTVTAHTNVSLTGVFLNEVPIAENMAAYGGVFKDSVLNPGANALEVKITDAQGKEYSSKYTAEKKGKVSAYFTTLNDKPYVSGMEITLPQFEELKKEPPKNVLKAVITSDFPIDTVFYSFNGGQSYLASVVPLVEKNQYEIAIPLLNLPAVQTKIAVEIDVPKVGVTHLVGNISVLREKKADEIHDDEVVIWQSFRDDEYTFYKVDNQRVIQGFGNFKMPITVALEKPVEGLALTEKDGVLALTATKEGYYTNNVVIVTDVEGKTFKSPAIDIRADFVAPRVEWLLPENPIWVQKEVLVQGIISENMGISRCDYSIDGGGSWRTLSLDEKNRLPNGDISFSQKIDMSMCDDGFIGIDVLVIDDSGNRTHARKVVQKDTQEPEVSIILPEPGAIVNGETRLVFNVRDKGQLDSSYYARSDAGKNYVAQKEEEKSAETGETYEGKGRFKLLKKPLVETLVGTKDKPLENAMAFEFFDRAGNKKVLNEWDFVIDAESDKPVTEIHVPSENEVITTDFVISGVVYDDDGECRIWYKIDDRELVSLDGYSSSFSINIPLSSMTDNEHKVTVFAEDIHGVRGEIVQRTFRISLEEPKGAVVTPAIEETVNGRVKMTGVASDKNGISKVQVSLDNGNTYNDVVGKENWYYEFDSHIIEDGTHVVFLKVWDGYGITGLYSSLINIDNTAPDIHLELPLDDSTVRGMLFFSGQTTDNVGLKNLYVSIRNLDIKQPQVPSSLARIDLEPSEIISKGIDISSLNNGFYNIEMTGEDAGGNITRVSRNIFLDKETKSSRIDILYPFNGEHIQGVFNLYGRVISDNPMETVTLFVDGEEYGGAGYGSTDVTEAGYFMFEVTPEFITKGRHNFEVKALSDKEELIASTVQYLEYTPAGPWVTIDNFTMGDFAFGRPYIEGSVGYAMLEEDLLALRSKDTSKEEKEALSRKTIKKVELSFDNGKTFTQVGTNKKWRYRIENEDMKEGFHFLVVRATMKNGETAITKSIIQIDKTAPFIRLISPGEGGMFNQAIEFAGLTSDDVRLKSVDIQLRSGDKAAYEVPSFIQGLYFDWHFWGATLYDVGLGLTFFDNNVKLQFQFGQMTQSQFDMLNFMFGADSKPIRYGGNVMGLKLLANIGYIPFRYYFGPNWEWLSASFALGANFSRFSYTQSGKAQILSALVLQMEFPRITLPNEKMFRTFSFYTEGQVWFIPTDVEIKVDSFKPQISAGIRINVF